MQPHPRPPPPHLLVMCPSPSRPIKRHSNAIQICNRHIHPAPTHPGKAYQAKKHFICVCVSVDSRVITSCPRLAYVPSPHPAHPHIRPPPAQHGTPRTAHQCPADTYMLMYSHAHHPPGSWTGLERGDTRKIYTYGSCTLCTGDGCMDTIVRYTIVRYMTGTVDTSYMR